MSKKVPPGPCEACGGLLPLKPIYHTRRRQHRPGSSQPHLPRTEERSPNECESSPEALPISDDSETENSSSKLRSYDSVLEEIQAIFANQKVKRETISPYLHRAQRHRERLSSRSRHHERSLAHQHAMRKAPKSRSPVDLPCLLHPHEGRHSHNVVPIHESFTDGPSCWRSMAGKNEEHASVACQSEEPASKHKCKRVVGRLPQDAVSNCSFDPLRISPSPRIHAAQCSSHNLDEGKARSFSPRKCPHGLNPSSPRNCPQPTVENDCYHDVHRIYDECHIHHIDQQVPATLIASPRKSSRTSHRHEGSAEASPQHLQPQQPRFSCHQHTVVLQHEECHLHARFPPGLSPRKCPRCGCLEQFSNDTKAGASLPEPGERTDRKAYVDYASSPERAVLACTQRLSPTCKMHGDSSKVDICGACCHPKKDHKDPEGKDLSLSPPKKRIEGCHLHRDSSPKRQEPKRVANPKCVDVGSPKRKDPLVWPPRRVRKPTPCSSAQWLDRIVASQKFPSHVVQQFLQGKRRCPPRVKKPKCPACVAKCLKARTHLTCSRDPCEREVGELWNSGFGAASSGIECKEPKRGKLTRLALSRTLIIKPVVKLSTAQGPWTTRQEYQVCSECRNPLVTKSGRWKCMLEEMSDVPKKCNPGRMSCQTMHGLGLPSDTGSQAIDLRSPELFSSFRLHSKLQKVQKETFDRRAALQVAQSEGIELDKELFDQLLPEIKKPKKGSPRRSSTRNYVCRRQRREVYRDLCKIVDPPMPICQAQEFPLRDVGVQVENSGRPLENSNKWKSSDFGVEPCLHSDRAVQSSVQLCAVDPPPCWPPQEPEKSWDEQHWAYLVEACKQSRMEQGVYGSCAACQ